MGALSSKRAVDPRTLFSRQGYLTGIEVLPPDEVASYRRAFDAVEGEVGREAAQVGLVGKERELEFVWRLATHPRVLDAVEGILGPDIVLLGTHFFCKYPSEQAGSSAFVDWHQDVTYWGLQPPKAVSAWLAIDDADVANGAMRVIPGSHRSSLVEHGKSEREGNLLSINQAIRESLFDATGAVDLELRAGTMSLHDGLLIHGSPPNRSDRRRCGLTIRFTTPDVRIVPEPQRRFPWRATLVRGEDRFEYNEFESALSTPG